MSSLLSTKEAAKRLNISVRRVQALYPAGRLPVKRIGNSFAIDEAIWSSLIAERTAAPVAA